MLKFINGLILLLLKFQWLLIEPIFGWKYYSKEEGNNTSKELKKKIEVLEKHLNGKEFIVGSDLTLADIFLFNKIRFVMMFLYREQMRNNVFKNVTRWFSKIMESVEAKKAYGRIILCKQVVKAHVPEKKKEEKKEEKKVEKKERRKRRRKAKTKAKKSIR